MQLSVKTRKTRTTMLGWNLTTLSTSEDALAVMDVVVVMAEPPSSVTSAPLSGVMEFWKVRGRTTLAVDRTKFKFSVCVVLVRLTGMAPTFECSDLYMNVVAHRSRLAIVS